MGRATVALPQVKGAIYRASPMPDIATAHPADASGPLSSGPLSSALLSSGPRSSAPLNTGSLTGEVLGRGEPDPPRRSRTIFMGLTIIGALLMLAAFGLIVVALTGEAVSSFFDSLLG